MTGRDSGAAPRSGRDGMIWGAATSAYQVEGAAAEDGRAPSIWDTFTRTPGRILDGTTGDVTIDHYHRYPDDVALMAGMGLSAYRFSVSWSRVQPYGRGGAINQAGLDFYRRLTDTLLGAGIEPWLTLYHWDLPQDLEDAGGWPARDTAFRFADYVAAVHDALADRVHNWITINEPWCAAFLGYASGEHAPGRREPAAAVQAAHHLLLAHGLATEVIRRRPGAVGVGPNLYAVSPATEGEADLDAARRVDGLQNRLFLDALLHGQYPEDVLSDLLVAGAAPVVQDGDMERISAPIDMLCINYYSRFTVTADAGGSASAAAAPTGAGSPWVGSEGVGFVSGGRAVTGMGWEIDASGLTEVLVRLARDYPRVPLVVTENGAAFDDVVEDGAVHDPDRQAFLEAHVKACRRAVEAGVPLRGYFVWSLFDNFEWAWGYTKRFGLIHVDLATQRRVLKDSAHWYAEMIRSDNVSP